MLEFTSDLHIQINTFEGQVSARFKDMHALDLSEIQEEVATLQVEVGSFTESQILAIHSVIPLITHSMAPCNLRCFDLFAEEETISVVGTKRDRD